MQKQSSILLKQTLLTIIMISLCQILFPNPSLAADSANSIVKLPTPRTDGTVSVEKAIWMRRSSRSFSLESLSLENIGQLLWAAQGVTSPQGYRTAPSAGGLYPLELFVVAGRVVGLEPGVYHYNGNNHELNLLKLGDLRSALSAVAFGQSWVNEGAAVLVFSGIYERTTHKYGQRGQRFVHIEAGHAAQNVYLQAAALEIGTVIVGGFDDKKVQKILSLDKIKVPLALMPVGHLP